MKSSGAYLSLFIVLVVFTISIRHYYIYHYCCANIVCPGTMGMSFPGLCSRRWVRRLTLELSWVGPVLTACASVSLPSTVHIRTLHSGSVIIIIIIVITQICRSIYGAVIVAQSAPAVHWVIVAQRKVAADLWTNPVSLSHGSTYRQLYCLHSPSPFIFITQLRLYSNCISIARMSNLLYFEGPKLLRATAVPVGTAESAY